MLKYLVQLTDDLLIAGIIIGMLFAYVRARFPKRGVRVLLAASGVAALAAVLMAVFVNTSNAVSQRLNLGLIAYIDLYTFLLFAVAFVVMAILLIGPLERRAGKVGAGLIYGAASLLIITLGFYALPAVLGYPFNFDVADGSVLSTDFIYRFLGCVLGFILALLTAVAAYKIEKALKSPLDKVLLFLVILVQALYFAGVAIQLMLSRRLIPQTHLLFSIVKLAVNYSEYFIFAILLLLLVAGIYLYVHNRKVMAPYNNPAEHRRLKAGMRRQRRWSLVLLVCILLAGVNLTVVDAYNNKVPDEAPVEECMDSGDELVVPFSQVDDGHLHRFGYETEDGVLVKFIVVQKPGSAAYGVGLDACDICGDAGYYERDDEIVCRRCDVVMNKNTIGFKGGCNPIVIDYHVEDGKIYVPKSTLTEHQNEFQ